MAESILIVGSGLGGVSAALELRKRGFEGRLTMIGDEHYPPYDRPPLSKGLIAGERDAASVVLHSRETLASKGIETWPGLRADGLDLVRRVVTAGAEMLPFDTLIIATGARPRMLPELEGKANVFVLRTLDDALAIRAAVAEASHVVVIGAGFIGSEVAASCRGLGRAVTVIEAADQPLRPFGPVGRSIGSLHEANGTRLRLGVAVTAARAAPSGLELSLTDGTTLEADAVVVGVGVTPATAWLTRSGLSLADGIVCDAALSAGAPGVYAVGDVARWHNELFGRSMRLEHWTNAQEQGRHVAKSILEGPRPFLGTNYVWSEQYGVRIQAVGLVTDHSRTVSGSLSSGRFVVLYRDGGRLVGGIGAGEPRALMRVRALIAEGVPFDAAAEEIGEATFAGG